MRTTFNPQSLVIRLRTEASGAVATEYAILIAFISIVTALAMIVLGENSSAFLNDLGKALKNSDSAVPVLPS